MRLFSWPLRMAAVAFLVVATVAAGSAFAASNTMPAGDAKLGDGTQTISGFTISAITYTLNATNPQNVDLVEFVAVPVPAVGATMKIKLVAAGTDWYSCIDPLTDGNIDCDTDAVPGPQATVSASDELTIVIAQ